MSLARIANFDGSFKTEDGIFVVAFICGVLNHNHVEFAVRRDHDLVHRGTDANELNIFVGMEGFDGTLSILRELVDEGTIVDGGFLVHGRTDGDTLQVDNDNALDTLVRFDSV